MAEETPQMMVNAVEAFKNLHHMAYFIGFGQFRYGCLHDNLAWKIVIHHGINPSLAWDKGNVDSWDDQQCQKRNRTDSFILRYFL